MSARESPNWLTLAILIGPIAALTNQALVYGVGTTACGHEFRPVMHLIEAVTLIICLVAIFFAFGTFRRFSAEGRTNFMAIVAIGAGAFSALVIIAQWAAVLTFTPCLRA